MAEPPLWLRCEARELRALATRFPSGDGDRAAAEVGRRAGRAGYLTREDFLALCEWKSPRSRPRCQSNAVGFVEEVTRTALATPNERLRIEVLTLLEGVSWPTASVILHFAHAEPYPILDVRALWSAGVDGAPAYRFDLWWAYTRFCRAIAAREGLTMRELDRALWQLSKERG